jgi:hypothetical protein
MGGCGHRLAVTKTHDRYAEDFERFVEEILSSPRAGS